MNKIRMVFVQNLSTTSKNPRKKLIKLESRCLQNNQLLTKCHVELEDNSFFLFFSFFLLFFNYVLSSLIRGNISSAFIVFWLLGISNRCHFKSLLTILDIYIKTRTKTHTHTHALTH